MKRSLLPCKFSTRLTSIRTGLVSRKFMYHIKNKCIFDMINNLRTPSQLSTEARLILSFVTVICKLLGVSALLGVLSM